MQANSSPLNDNSCLILTCKNWTVSLNSTRVIVVRGARTPPKGNGVKGNGVKRIEEATTLPWAIEVDLS